MPRAQKKPRDTVTWYKVRARRKDMHWKFWSEKLTPSDNGTDAELKHFCRCISFIFVRSETTHEQWRLKSIFIMKRFYRLCKTSDNIFIAESWKVLSTLDSHTYGFFVLLSIRWKIRTHLRVVRFDCVSDCFQIKFWFFLYLFSSNEWVNGIGERLSINCNDKDVFRKQ